MQEKQKENRRVSTIIRIVYHNRSAHDSRRALGRERYPASIQQVIISRPQIVDHHVTHIEDHWTHHGDACKVAEKHKKPNSEVMHAISETVSTSYTAVIKQVKFQVTAFDARRILLHADRRLKESKSRSFSLTAQRSRAEIAVLMHLDRQGIQRGRQPAHSSTHPQTPVSRGRDEAPAQLMAWSHTENVAECS